MPQMVFSKNNGNGKNDSKDIAVKVTGFIKNEQGATGVTGVNMSTGENVTVFLTDRGKDADNPKRNSLAKLEGGYKVSRDKYQLVPGGIVSFKSAFKMKDKDFYLSSWPNVLAHNPSDAEKYVTHAKMAMLTMGESDNGPYGTLKVYDCNVNNHIVADSFDKIGASVRDLLANSNYQKPGFLVRKMNENGEVIGFQTVMKTWNSVKGQPATTDEIADNLVAALKEKANGEASYNLLPYEQYQVSPKSLETDANGKSQLPKFLTAEKAFYKENEEGGTVVYAKEVYAKLGGDNNEFVNAVHPVDRYGEGVSPLDIGITVHFDQEQTNTASAQTKPAQTSGFDPDNPFPEEDESSSMRM